MFHNLICSNKAKVPDFAFFFPSNFAISQLSRIFVVLKHSTREEIDRPESVERIFYIYQETIL